MASGLSAARMACSRQVPTPKVFASKRFRGSVPQRGTEDIISPVHSPSRNAGLRRTGALELWSLGCYATKSFMSTKTSALKRAVGAFKKATGPQQYGLHGKPFICPFCGHDRFALGSGASIMGLYTLACADCGRVEFFAKLPPVL
jgi:hypothetical protein